MGTRPSPSYGAKVRLPERRHLTFLRSPTSLTRRCTIDVPHCGKQKWYACMYACMHVCVYVCIHVWFMQEGLYVYLCTLVHYVSRSLSPSPRHTHKREHTNTKRTNKQAIEQGCKQSINQAIPPTKQPINEHNPSEHTFIRWCPFLASIPKCEHARTHVAEADMYNIDMSVLAAACKQATSKEILLWMTPTEAPKALQASECRELLDPLRASCCVCECVWESVTPAQAVTVIIPAAPATPASAALDPSASARAALPPTASAIQN